MKTMPIAILCRTELFCASAVIAFFLLKKFLCSPSRFGVDVRMIKWPLDHVLPPLRPVDRFVNNRFVETVHPVTVEVAIIKFAERHVQRYWIGDSFVAQMALQQPGWSTGKLTA